MATIYDVARHAGVSPKTVSRVLNGDAPVNETTRAAVGDSIRQLGYVPSNAARAMRSNKTGLIGIITGAISGSPSSNEDSGLPELIIVQSIQKALSAEGLIPLIVDTGGGTQDSARLLRTLKEHRVEAVLHVADYHRRVTLPDDATDKPILLVNCFDDRDTPCILPDDRNGEKALIDALIGAGHRRIAFLTLPEGMIAQRERLLGYRDSLAEAGLAYDADLIWMAREHNQQGPEAATIGHAVDKMMALPNPPTVFCCGNDRMALLLYGVLRSKGYAVPNDVSVAGYDDYRLISETLYPPLTTAVLPYEAMGREAARLLLAHLREDVPLPSEPITIGGSVVWRQSVTGKLPNTTA